MKKIKLKSYQKQAIEFCYKRNYAALFIDPGLGKTSIMLVLVSLLKAKRKIRKTLVIAPLIVLNEWKKEINKWSQLDHLKIVNLHEDKKHGLKKHADIYCINPESLHLILKQLHHFDLLIVDESSKFKSHKSQRFAILKKHLHKFKRRYILNGTPAPNGLVDLFAQIFILDFGKRLFKNIGQFRNRFMQPVGFYKFNKWEMRKGSEKTIYKRLKNVCFRISENDEIKLPDLIINDIHLNLPTAKQKQYDRIEKDFFIELNGNKNFMLSPGSKYSKCSQLCNGGMYKEVVLNGPKKYLNFHSIKLQKTADLVDELHGKPCIIAFRYTPEKQRLLKTLKHIKNKSVIDGKTKPIQANQIIEKWNAGNLQVLICQISVVSHGLNLQTGGSDLILFSLTDNLDHYLQIIKRLHRIGTKKSVRVHRLIMNKTLDQVNKRRLNKKDSTQADFLRFLHDYKNSKVKV